MPRPARLNTPGTVYHLISRFVDRHWFIERDEERELYLRLLGVALQRSDWRCLAYAIMSNHIHLAMVAGEEPLGPLMRCVHAPFAVELNQTRDRIGSIFVRGPKDYAMTDVQVPQLIAYIHNNPVRAGVVATAADSTWTSHGAYLHAQLRPAWLQVDEGLARCGLSDARELDRFVGVDHTTRADLMMGPVRVAARRRGAIEVATPIASSPVQVMLVARPWARVRAEPGHVVKAVASRLEIAPEVLCSRSPVRMLVEGRRLAIHCGRRLGLTTSDIAAALGISQQAASKLGSAPIAAEVTAACEEVVASLLGLALAS